VAILNVTLIKVADCAEIYHIERLKTHCNIKAYRTIGINLFRGCLSFRCGVK